MWPAATACVMWCVQVWNSERFGYCVGLFDDQRIWKAVVRAATTPFRYTHKTRAHERESGVHTLVPRSVRLSVCLCVCLCAAMVAMVTPSCVV